MTLFSLDRAASEVLRHYPLSVAGVAALGNRGGFSGARLWSAGGFGLRAWPPHGPSAQRLAWIHALMARARHAGLAYVPAVLRTLDGQSSVEHAGRLWEMATWLPGRADFRERPTALRLQAACQAVARLHQAWAGDGAPAAPCPAIAQRLGCAREWLALVEAGWRPELAGADDDPIIPWAKRAWMVLPAHVCRIPDSLTPWAERLVRLQPCLCDVWHAHVLFEGDVVSGLVDYGSVKPNHVAADLARLLGSLVADDWEMWQLGLSAYHELRPLSAEEEDLATLLDRTGTVLGAVNWLRWLYEERRSFEDRQAIAGRLAAIVTRMERWPA
jgi:Ser/Thr protein kinase RdoA (MazF antagonist)